MKYCLELSLYCVNRRVVYRCYGIEQSGEGAWGASQESKTHQFKFLSALLIFKEAKHLLEN